MTRVTPRTAGIIDITTGKSFSAPAEEEQLIIPPHFICRQHMRWAENQGLNPHNSVELFGAALVAVLGENMRFIRRCGYSHLTRQKIHVSKINATLKTMSAACCYLSAPERRRALEFAKNPVEIEKARTKMQQAAMRQADVAFAERLKQEFKITMDRAVVVAALFGPARREMAVVALRQGLTNDQMEEMLRTV